MHRYAIYARKSEKDNDDFIKSIDDQKHYCQLEVARHGLTLVAIYEENLSAKIPGVRPEYKRLIASIKAGKVNALLVYSVNRLTRNVEEGGALAQMLVEGRLREIRTPSAVYRQGDNIMPLLLEQATSAQFSLDLSKRMADAVDRTVAAGGWPRSAPVGYLNQRHPLYPKKSVVVTDPERFDLVKRLFEFALTDKYSGRELAKIASEEWGLKRRQTPKYPARPIRATQMYALLANPFYAGYVSNNGKLYRGNHEAAVSIADFKQLQTLLVRRAKPRKYRKVFAYKGTIQCGYCGQLATGERRTKGGRVYEYYHCSDTYARCTKRGIREDEFEKTAFSRLLSVAISPLLAPIITDAILRAELERLSYHAEVGLRQEKTLNDIEEQQGRLVDLMVTGVITDQDMYRKKEAQLRAERDKIQLEVHSYEHEQEKIALNLKLAISSLTNAENIGKANPRLRNALMRGMATYTLYGNELSIEVDPLLEAIANFARQFSPQFEPNIDGSGSGKSVQLSDQDLFGTPTSGLLEPPKELLELLEQSNLSSAFEELERLLETDGAQTYPSPE